jgi:hypothetical protein
MLYAGQAALVVMELLLMFNEPLLNCLVADAALAY